MPSRGDGIEALESGDIANAMEIFHSLAQDDPDNAGARVDLAHTLRLGGHVHEAAVHLTEALAFDAGHELAATRLAALLSEFTASDPSEFSPAGLTAALDHIRIDRQCIVNTAFTYLKLASPLKDALAMAPDDAAEWMLSSKGRGLLRDRLFLAALSSETCMDLDIAALLAAGRRALLRQGPSDKTPKKHLVDFTCALIRQCEINEYVFAVDAGEQRELAQISIVPEAIHKGSKKAVWSFCLRALYEPIHVLLGTEAKDADFGGVSPQAVGALISQHLNGHRREAECAAAIESLDAARDDTLDKVAAFYEGNPYPRWQSIQFPPTDAKHRQLGALADRQHLSFFEHPFNVLVAGCGTGQHALKCAVGYGGDAQVLAFDLSRASLAYGAAMAERFGVTNIRFLQMDLLGAEALDETFHVIESIGVLHHLADPLAGWRALLTRLAPGGLMRIGLYSELARREITELRQAITDRGIEDSADSVRAFRQELIAAPQGQPGTSLRTSGDFYTLNNFRDLLFHVNEVPLALPQIKDFLAGQNLTFLGFEIPPWVRHHHGDDMPAASEATDLDRWWQFEQAHPDVFQGMYVFWCRSESEPPPGPE